jgi:hypothetical protein
MSSSSTPYRFWDGNRLRKTATEFKTAPEKIFDHPAIFPADGRAQRATPGFTKKSWTLLKPKSALLVFCLPRHAVRAPLAGPG